MDLEYASSAAEAATARASANDLALAQHDSLAASAAKSASNGLRMHEGLENLKPQMAAMENDRLAIRTSVLLEHLQQHLKLIPCTFTVVISTHTIVTVCNNIQCLSVFSFESY